MNPLGLIRVSVADIRRGPDQRSEQVTQAIMGTAISVFSRRREKWLRIQLPDGYKGYIHEGLVQLGDKKLVRRWSRQANVQVTVPWSMIYARRSPHSDPISDVVIETKLCRIEDSARWIRVRLPDGRRGWLARHEITRGRHLIHPKGGTAENVLQLARRFLGIPYLWGGLTPKGFDCSGLTQTVFGLNGYPLPRDAYQQFRCGRKIRSREDLAPADLLFFQASGAKRVTHVAIHLAGERFIHCSDLVKINSLNSSASDYVASLEENYVGARRIVGG